MVTIVDAETSALKKKHQAERNINRKISNKSSYVIQYFSLTLSSVVLISQVFPAFACSS